jgi:hypothetical protein
MRGSSPALHFAHEPFEILGDPDQLAIGRQLVLAHNRAQLGGLVAQEMNLFMFIHELSLMCS